MKRKWTTEEEEYLLKNYFVQDISLTCKYLKRTTIGVNVKAYDTFGLKNKHISSYSFKKSGPTTGITLDDLIEKYKELQSCRKVGKYFGINKSSVGYYLKPTGILNKPVKYSCDDTYFTKDTPDSFYWAGFIASDGCVKLKNKKYKYLSIGLSNKDEQLEKFKRAVKFNGPINISPINTGGYKSEIAIRSDELFDSLYRFGIVERKSLIFDSPDWLFYHKHLSHFLRGYSDGDGSFYVPVLKNNRKIEQLHFSARGTRKFLTNVKNVLEEKCETIKSERKPRLNSGIYTLEYGGNRVSGRIRDYLYADSTYETRLDRKFDLVYDDRFINLPTNFNHKPVIGTNMKTGEHIFLNSMKEGTKYGFTRSAISACCRNVYETHKGYTWKYA